MRTVILAQIGFFVATIVSAMGSDLPPSKAPLAIAAPVTWTGFYVGINGGAGMADGSFFDPDGFSNTNIKFQTAFGTAGGQFGYNWQWRAMVLGVEGDLNWAHAKASTGFNLCCGETGSTHFRFDAFASIRGRMGFAFDNALIYVTAGPVWGHFKSDTSELGDFSTMSSDKAWHPGLALGSGVEFVLANNWALRGEYLFLHFRDINRPLIDLSGFFLTCGDIPCRINYAYSAHVARLGINYRFGN
jgi:outer membrane immunogenic protein